MKSKMYLVFLGILAIVVVSAVTPAVLADEPNDVVVIEKKQGNVLLKTPYLRVALKAGRPDIMFWMANSTYKQKTIPVYHIGFYYVGEFYGDDMIIDSREELGGKIYNLISQQVTWELTIENYTDELRAILTSSPLANGAVITFVYHLYLEDRTVTREVTNTNTTTTNTVVYTAKALTEVKFDIVVSNWTFSPGATGLAFLVKVHELAYRHRVRRGNHVNDPENNYRINSTETSTNGPSDDPEKNGIEFLNTRDEPEGFFSWTPVADVYDLEDNYITSVNCIASVISKGYDTKEFRGRKFGVDYVNLILTYPNYGDNLKLVHDPTLGVEPENVVVPFSTAAIIALPVVAFMTIVLVRKKK